MKLLVLILNKTELLDDVLEALAHVQLGGATILQSQGMARVLRSSENREDDSFLGALLGLLDPEREKNVTLLTVIPVDRVTEAVTIIETVVGDLTQPDTGIVFTLPVDFIKGISGAD